jgi:hypothetical protein
MTTQLLVPVASTFGVLAESPRVVVDASNHDIGLSTPDRKSAEFQDVYQQALLENPMSCISKLTTSTSWISNNDVVSFCTFVPGSL